MEEQFKMFDDIEDNLNIIVKETEKNLLNAFMNSLDDFGNPNSFNIDKFIN